MPSEREAKKQIEAVFNDVATRYDTNRFFVLSAENLIAYANPDGSERMLDVCAGTGNVAIRAAKQYPAMRIDALDLSAEMLKQAQTKARGQGIDNINFVVSDVDTVDYGADTFDLITCGYGLFFFPDMENSFSKIVAALKSGGKFIFSTFTEQAFSPFTEMFMNDLQRYGVDTPESSTNRLQSAERINELCSNCGVGNVRIETAGIRYDITPDNWWDLINSAAYQGLLKQVNTSELENFRGEHLSAVSQLARGGKIELIADSYYGIVTR